MKIIRDNIWYSLLIVTSVLYVYRVTVLGINVSPFRALFLIWLLVFAKDLLFLRLRFRRAYLVYVAIFAGILTINGVDLFRMSNPALYGRDTINHLINVSLVGLLVVYLNQDAKIDRLIKLYSAFSLLALAIAIYLAATGSIPFEEFLKAYRIGDEGAKADYSIRWEGAPRLASSFYDPNFYGLYLCFVIIFAFYLIYFARAGVLHWIALLTSVGALAGSMSRSAMIGFVVVLAVTLLKIPRSSRFVLTLLASLMLGALLGLALGAGTQSWPGILDRVLDQESAYDRLRYVENGIDAFARNPLFGVGAEGLITSDITSPSAHLVYLSILAKFGLVGFAAYATFIFYPLFYVLKKGRALVLKYRYLILATYLSLAVMYLAYDYYAFLEFQYIVFGIAYAIILNRLGVQLGAPPVRATVQVSPRNQAGSVCVQS